MKSKLIGRAGIICAYKKGKEKWGWFLNISYWNLALLEKQGWRLIQNPSSLAAPSFNLKPFSFKTNILWMLGSNPSYMWRSIWEARIFLLSGVRWRVGKGNSINVWDELPSSFRVSSPARCNWPGLKQRVVIFFILIKVAGKKEFILRHLFLDFFFKWTLEVAWVFYGKMISWYKKKKKRDLFSQICLSLGYEHQGKIGSMESHHKKVT